RACHAAMTRWIRVTLLLAAAVVAMTAGSIVIGQGPPPAPPPAASSPAPTTPPAAPPATAPKAESAAPRQAQAAGPGRTRTGKISGTVTDPVRRILSGLLVKLESRGDPGMLRVTSTDMKGQYHFKDLPPGLYDVRVEADGFGPGSKDKVEV